MSNNYFRSNSGEKLPTPCNIADHRNYNQGMQNVMTSASLSGETKQSSFVMVNKPVRFNEYFELLNKLLENIENKIGSEEPLICKKLRPFILSNEVVTTKGSVTTKKTRSKLRSMLLMKEITKIYTASNIPPGISNYVATNTPYRFSQQLESLAWQTTSVGAATFNSYAFTFSLLNDAANYALIFDQYKIDRLEFWLVKRTASGSPGPLHTTIDYTDATSYTTIAQALDNTNCATAEGTEYHYRAFRPHIAVASYSGSFASFTSVPSTWISMVSTGVQHYGFKIACEISSVATIYDLFVRVHFECRSVI